MEPTLGIYLYSYLFLKLAKMLAFLIISYVFSSTKSENKRAEQVLPGREAGGSVQIMYTQVNKCKNDKKVSMNLKNVKKINTHIYTQTHMPINHVQLVKYEQGG
jgi:hypothetical protein